MSSRNASNASNYTQIPGSRIHFQIFVHDIYFCFSSTSYYDYGTCIIKINLHLLSGSASIVLKHYQYLLIYITYKIHKQTLYFRNICRLCMKIGSINKLQYPHGNCLSLRWMTFTPSWFIPVLWSDYLHYDYIVETDA